MFISEKEFLNKYCSKCGLCSMEGYIAVCWTKYHADPYKWKKMFFKPIKKYKKNKRKLRKLFTFEHFRKMSCLQDGLCSLSGNCLEQTQKSCYEIFLTRLGLEGCNIPKSVIVNDCVEIKSDNFRFKSC